jgi:hypothetical protein
VHEININEEMGCEKSSILGGVGGDKIGFEFGAGFSI